MEKKDICEGMAVRIVNGNAIDESRVWYIERGNPFRPGETDSIFCVCDGQESAYVRCNESPLGGIAYLSELRPA